MAQHEASMTVFYSKSTGEIKGLSTGIQNMNYFGIDAEDYSLIWDFKVITIDAYVLQNPNKFIIDLSGAEPILNLKKENINQYPTI